MICSRPALGLWASVIVLLAGCASVDQATLQAQAYSPEKAGLERAEATSLVVEQWWRGLGDEQLNRLIEQALKDQPTMAAVRARLDSMLAVADATHAQSMPQVGASAVPSRQLFTANSIYPPPLGGHTYNSAEVTLGVDWSIDLFGLHAAQWAAAKGQMQAARADVVSAGVSLAAQVARVYIALARAQAWHDVAAQTLQQQEETRALIHARAQAGLDNQIDQRQSEGQSSDAHAQLEAINEQIMLLRHQLAALCAMNPQALDQLKPQLETLQLEPLPVTIGADLLGRRADVVAARWRVQAAMSDITAAEKQFYPNVDLGAFVGYNAIGFDQVFKGASKEAGIAPAIHLPLFSSGLLTAQLKGREGEAKAAVANYNAVVLDAVRQTRDAITSSQSLQQQTQDQSKALNAAKQSYQLSLQRYEAGLVNKMVVLRAQSQWLAQQKQQAELQARALMNQVSLWTALGGGFKDAPESIQ